MINERKNASILTFVGSMGVYVGCLFVFYDKLNLPFLVDLSLHAFIHIKLNYWGKLT